jgi:hypothetical protein
MGLYLQFRYDFAYDPARRWSENRCNNAEVTCVA